MGRRCLFQGVLLAGLTGALAACAGAPPTTALPPPEGVAAQPERMAAAGSNAITIDETIFHAVPKSVPETFASNRFLKVETAEISTGFTPDAFRREPGTHLGFAPGFTADILSRSRFLPIGEAFVPYYLVQGRYVPLSYFDEALGLYIYPTLVLVDGVYVPMYQVARTLFEPYAMWFPVTVTLGWMSPILITEVRPPLRMEPRVIRPIPDVDEAHVIGEIAGIEKRIESPITVDRGFAERIRTHEEARIAKLPERDRQRIKERRDKAPPSVVPEARVRKPLKDRMEEAKPEPAKPEQVKPEPAKPEQVKPEQVKPEQVKPEPAKPEQVKPEPAKPEPARPERAKTEQSKAEKPKI